MDEGKDSNAGGKRDFINNNINKANKNYPVGEKQTGWSRQGRAGQGRAGQDRTPCNKMAGVKTN